MMRQGCCEEKKMWRKLRIAVLLFVFATVARQAWVQENDLEWGDNFYVALYPVNADGSAAVAAYLDTLTQDQFDVLTEYFTEEAKRYGFAVYHPFEFRLGTVIREVLPLPPKSASRLQSVLWSLQFRWWAWHNSPKMQVAPKIRLYLLYHDPAVVKALSHSTALSKGRVGLVNVFGDAAAHDQNAVIMAHELLHTVGATDKYDLATNQPIVPEGLAEPGKEPRYPQAFAELMAGRIPVSDTDARIPESLVQTLIGEKTAREIQWIKEGRSDGDH
jgi:hypothetical protein